MPNSTPITLLDRLRREPDDEAWRRLHDLYAPLLRGWLRRHQIHDADADDLVQEVLSVVVRRLPEFAHGGFKGAFRGWLRGILVLRLRTFWRRQRRQAGTADDPNALLDQLEDPASDLARLWEREHDRTLVRRLLEIVELEFEPATWQAFRRLMLDGESTAQVAAALGLSPNAVRIAKSRVMRRLRQEIGDLID